MTDDRGRAGARAAGDESDEAAAIAADAACPIRYTRSDDLNIAYQITGAGDVDLVLVAGFVSHLMLDWTERRHAHFLHRLGTFSRLIRFDKRGTGMSDRPGALPDLETRMGDVVAVMDAARSERAVLFGYSEGGPMSILYAASHPERVHGLVIYSQLRAAALGPGLPVGIPSRGAGTVRGAARAGLGVGGRHAPHVPERRRGARPVVGRALSGGHQSGRRACPRRDELAGRRA